MINRAFEIYIFERPGSSWNVASPLTEVRTVATNEVGVVEYGANPKIYDTTMIYGS